MEDIAEQLAIRDRFLRKRRARLTPEQHLEEMDRLQQVTWDYLRGSPEGYARFLKRNFRSRAVQQLSSDVS